MGNPHLVLSELTLSAIQAEATRAHLKHGEFSMLGPHHSAADRLSILAEEAGEAADEAMALAQAHVLTVKSGQLLSALGRVAHQLTHDQGGGIGYADKDKLEKELIQVAAMAATWVEQLNEASRNA